MQSNIERVIGVRGVFRPIILMTAANSRAVFNTKGSEEQMKTTTQRLLASVTASLTVAAASDTLADAGDSQNKRARGVMEEVVVTATRREERLQDVPISIGVISGEDLDRSSARGVSESLNQVAGVSVIETQPGRSSFAIRGVIGETSSSYGTSTTGNYLDEVPFVFNTRTELPDMNAFDLSRVEVLRGPQGTLYGVNALSGVVRVLTNDPDLDALEMKGRIRAGTTEHGSDSYNGDVAVNVPLMPGKLAIRGVASYSDLGGYVDSIPSARRDINDTEAEAYRFKLSYQPNETLSVKLGLSRSTIDNGAPSGSDRELTTPSTAAQFDERAYDTYNLVIEQRWSKVSLLSSTSYLDYDVETSVQLIPRLPDSHYLSRLKLNSFTQEFRLLSRGEAVWKWSAGAFYRDATETQFDQLLLFFPSPFIIKPASESYAIFGDLVRSFAEGKFDITAGLRYFNDDIVKTNPSGLDPNIRAPTDYQRYDRVTGRLVATYKPTPDRTYYASVATGFRTGLGRDAGILAFGVTLPAAHPDNLINYEIGTKGTLLNGAITYDGAVYYMKWKDLLQPLSVLVQTAGGPIYLGASTNGGTASGAGVEGSISYHPTSMLTLQVAAGWNDLKYEEDVYSNGVVLFPEGGRVNLSPEWTGSVSASYRVATPRAGMDAVFYGGLAYRSEVATRALLNNASVESVSSYDLSSNVRFGLETDRWSAELYGANILDKREPILPASSDLDSRSLYQRPRTFGLQVAFRY